MDRLDEVFELYNEEKIRQPIPVLFADSKIGRDALKHLKKFGIKCGYIKVPVIACEDVEAAQEILGATYPTTPKGE